MGEEGLAFLPQAGCFHILLERGGAWAWCRTSCGIRMNHAALVRVERPDAGPGCRDGGNSVSSRRGTSPRRVGDSVSALLSSRRGTTKIHRQNGINQVITSTIAKRRGTRPAGLRPQTFKIDGKSVAVGREQYLGCVQRAQALHRR